MVSELPPERDRVFFGAIVELEDDNGVTHRYRLVGPDEFDDAPEYISIDSPMARALLKKRCDDDVEVNDIHYVVTAISYPPPGT